MNPNLSMCAECGMAVNPGEYHPFAACLMFKACHNGDDVRANLHAVRSHATQQDAKKEAGTLINEGTKAAQPDPAMAWDAELIATLELSRKGG